MTPNDIEVLIHCHCCPHRHPRLDAPAVQGAIRMLETAGMVKHVDEDIWSTTERGAAHVEQLCSLEFPTQAWIGADGKILGSAL